MYPLLRAWQLEELNGIGRLKGGHQELRNVGSCTWLAKPSSNLGTCGNASRTALLTTCEVFRFADIAAMPPARVPPLNPDRPISYAYALKDYLALCEKNIVAIQRRLNTQWPHDHHYQEQENASDGFTKAIHCEGKRIQWLIVDMLVGLPTNMGQNPAGKVLPIRSL